MIQRVKEFKVGDVISLLGQDAKITKFPTRTSVCLDNVRPHIGHWSNSKITIQELRKLLGREHIISNTEYLNAPKTKLN